MNCVDARRVWKHPEGFIAGLKQYLPGVFERIEETVQNAYDGRSNPCLEAIKVKVGNRIRTPFFVHHAEDGDSIAEQVHDVLGDITAKLLLDEFFSQAYGTSIHLGNICCKGCTVSFGNHLTLEEALVLQIAAVTTGPQGEELS